MQLTDINTIKQILRENGLSMKKDFGQNFLVAEPPLFTLIKVADLTDKDTVIEVGPGLGTLTQELAKKAGLVLAIEKDYKLVEWLRKYFKNQKNIKIVHADVLQWVSAETLMSPQLEDGYKVVSNLPYNITSPAIRKFLESSKKPSEMILTIQKEVAERICAKAGSSDRGLLTVMVEFYADAKIVEIVGRENFWPIPNVDSAIIKINLSTPPRCAAGATPPRGWVNDVDPESFFRLVKIGFSQKRRQIVNPLSAGLRLPKNQIIDILKLAKIDPQNRAEDLTFDDWLGLMEGIKNEQ